MTSEMNDLAPAPSRRRGVRCPACGARVTASATWCSLCFTDLVSAPAASAEVVAPATTSADAGKEADDAAPVPSAGLAAPATTTADADRLAEQMLAELAATGAPTRRPPSFLSGTGGRSVAMLVGTVVMAALGFGLLALGGALL